jgi:hypothetical protein
MKYKIFILITTLATVLCGEKIAAQDLQNELSAILAEENVDMRIKSADTFNNKLVDIIKRGAKAEKVDIPQRISQVISRDKSVGIYTWSVPTVRGMYKYYGILKSPKGIFILDDVNINNEYMSNEKFTDSKWYGAIYYDIIETTINGKRAYTLLGNDLKGMLSKKKVIEILSFDGNENPVFGANIFADKDNCRIIFEYNARSSMYMRYSSELKTIVYNFLVPVNPNFEGDYRFYVADITYDGLKLKNGKWTKVENVVFERED